MLAFDAVLVLASMALTAGLHQALRDVVSWLKEPPQFPEYALVAYLSVPTLVALLSYMGLDEVLERVLSRRRLVLELLKVHVAAAVAIAALAFVTQATINRSLVGLFLGTTFILLYAEKVALLRWRRFQHESGQGRDRLLFVGAPGPAMEGFANAVAADALPEELAGYLGPAGSGPATLPRLGDASDLERVLHDESIDRVVFFPPNDDPTTSLDALRQCEMLGIPASFSIDMARPADAVPRVELLHAQPFVTFDVAPKPPAALALKHALDFAAAALLLLLLSPLLLAVTLAIALTMGRPVLFTQERAGLQGRRFRMLKFRTMVKDAEAQRAALESRNEMSGPVFKVTDDPRVTTLGKWLRKSSIDELPQLVNVLLGTMSLVGPRPLPSAEQRKIQGWHRRRLSMKPGLTGLWQVSGRNNVDFEAWMRLDLRYVDEWSLANDLKLLLRTIPVVLLGKGAK